jgi:hypothetical protein
MALADQADIVGLPMSRNSTGRGKLSVSISRYIPLYATVGTLTLGFGAAAIAQTPAQDPFPIPDTTNATCVILDMKQKNKSGPRSAIKLR